MPQQNDAEDYAGLAKRIAGNRTEVFADLRTFGGHLECLTCHRQEPLGDPAARVAGGSWPKCCGGTMRWITAREEASHAAEE
jgi:hypothetical protein